MRESHNLKFQAIDMQNQISSQNLTLFATAVQELSLARDLSTVMEIVRKAARQLTGADGATFILREGENCYYADEDTIAPLWKGQRFPQSSCVSGWVMTHAIPAIIPDIYADDRVPQDAYRPTFVKSLAVVPIRKIAPIGAIGNYWASNYTPTEAEVNLLQSLADITSVTMENINIYAELENRVKERTKELEAKNKDLQAFSYSLSHDLKSPLRSIQLYTENLKERFLTQSAEGTNQAEKVIKRANRMNSLIDALLLFFSAGDKKLYTTQVPMDAVVKEVCEDLKDDLKPRASFMIHQLPNVEGDPHLLQQVWTNLISNAIKYSSKAESPVIEIGCKEAEEGVIFFVRDNGIGFSENDKLKLFKVFERLHSHEQYEGSGLGLAIVERVIAKHGGRVWAEAAPGDGATFYFHLPSLPVKATIHHSHIKAIGESERQ